MLGLNNSNVSINHFSINTQVIIQNRALSLARSHWLAISDYNIGSLSRIITGGSAAQWSGRCLEIRRSRVQDPLWPLVEFDPGSPWFNFLAALVNSQLVRLRPVGILNSCCCSVPSFPCVSLALKSPCGERSIKYVLYYYWLSADNHLDGQNGYQ